MKPLRVNIVQSILFISDTVTHFTSHWILFLALAILLSFYGPIPLQWRYNGRDGVPNHQPRDCLLNRLFRRRSKKTSKLRVTDLCVGNSPGTGEFRAQMASNAENVSISWRHHDTLHISASRVNPQSHSILMTVLQGIWQPKSQI